MYKCESIKTSIKFNTLAEEKEKIDQQARKLLNEISPLCLEFQFINKWNS